MPRTIAPARAGAVVLAAALALICLLCGSARAGTYDITSCNPDGSTNGWSAYSNASWVRSSAVCPTNGDLTNRGLSVENAPNVGVVGSSGGGLVFRAPTGTSLAGIGASVRVQRWDTAYWLGLITASGSNLYGAWGNDGSTGYLGSSLPYTWFGLNRESDVHLEVGCSGLCDTGAFGSAPYYRVWAQLYDPIRIRIEDDNAPSETITGGSALASPYVAGVQGLTYSATDASGIRATRLYVDGTKLRDDTRTCNFENPVPCSNVSDGSYTLDTHTVADGSHVLKVETVDSAGNAASQSRTIQVDNTAPSAPAVSVSGGEAWRSTNKFDVSWTNPTGQTSPIVKAHYVLCPSDQPAGCMPPVVQSAAGISSLSGLSVPRDGDYTLNVWLEDAAGNADEANSSAAVHLRFDGGDPGEAAIPAPAGWLGARDVAHGYDVSIRLADSRLAPPSGIAGYAVATDGSEPGTAINTGPDGAFHIEELREGVTTVEARAISGSGVASAHVGSAELRVDATAPDVDIAGGPDPEAWQPAAVELRIHAVDQEPLSGMAGGHVSYSVDGGPEQDVAGDTANVRVAADGEHTVAYSATDLAGNRAEARQLNFKIDSTPPGAVRLDDPGRWLNSSDEVDYQQPVTVDTPLSGVAGYSFTTDGSDPDAISDSSTDVLELGPLTEGETTVRARAISGSGLAGEIGTVTLHVDRTPPDVQLRGAPAPDQWTGEPAHLRLEAADAVSGMRGSGAHLTYLIDDGEPVTVDGDVASVDIDEGGEHTLRYFAVDVAGNRSATERASFKIDLDKPGAAAPDSSNGWITSAGPIEEHIRMADGQAAGRSGLAGFSVTTDGSDPDATPDIGADGQLTLADLPDGVTTVKARAISGSGLASDAVGVGTIKVDRTAPLLRLHRPDGQLPARLEAEATDPTSGLASGRIEIRRAGAVEWKALDTSVIDGRLVAAIDPLALAGATFAMRAVASDVAGNVRTATTFGDGSTAELTINAPEQGGSAPAPTPAPSSANAPVASGKNGGRGHVFCPAQKHPRSHRRHHARKRRARHRGAICGRVRHKGGEKHRPRHLGGRTHKPARGIAG
ncbi:MAG TPA: chitobiase/beta-hexosaminidase C-terminal domain-containing protein [Thermoleophilaceae bacterium]